MHYLVGGVLIGIILVAVSILISKEICRKWNKFKLNRRAKRETAQMVETGLPSVNPNAVPSRGN
jgi:hypothetical protein